jgi:outer membrane lipoprotein-sorting protein
MKDHRVAYAGLCALALAMFLPQARAELAGAADSDPRVQEIFDAYVEAIGGEKALTAKKTRYVEGTANFPAAGIQMPFAIYQKTPDKLRMEMEMPQGMGTMIQVVNGDEGWFYNPAMGYQEMPPGQLRQLARDTDLHFEANLDEFFSETELLDGRTVNGSMVDVIEAKTEEGDAYTLYFERGSGLLVRMEQVVDMGAQGEMNAPVDLSDYREVDGVLIPFTMKVKSDMGEMTMALSKAEHDRNMADSLFQRPEGK